MAGGFTTRRDSSANNVPVVGYQDTADAQDVILWAAVQVTETGNTDASGNFQATNLPIIDATHDWYVDSGGVGRQRLINGKDITAKDSGGNTLYAGQANGQTGVIPLYKDSGLTTSVASLTGVQVTYWTLQPVAVDAQGHLVVSVNGTVNVSLSGSLPAGTNTIGQVIPFNPLDNGGEQASIRIRDSAAGNALAAMGYNADSKALPSVGYPLAVSALPWLYNGDGTASRVRNARYFHSATATASGNTTVWTPASGKTVAIRGFFLIASGTVTVQFTAAGTAVGPQLPLVAGIPVVVNFENIWMPGSAGQAIGVNLSAAATVGVMLWGTEE
ncbi:hypothetical protein GCM10025857_06710 [Alicyclobacillus contaminans]|uniref:hypothetical protein n=1 Tax=Alicyclobacillus contaminans TaxID=392016 RepID=UPI00041CA388|nr:hypothetical protein [Alicyclobacillus contaminans]GMA49314.1 hypothetical protein GCM10025857_06710 [Alicyclobacillus contaminans]